MSHTLASPETIHELIQTGIRLIDIRTPEEYREEKIEPSLNIPLAELSQHYFDDDIIIFTCAHGVRTQHYLDLILSVSSGKVLILKGGLHHWKEKGFRVS